MLDFEARLDVVLVLVFLVVGLAVLLADGFLTLLAEGFVGLPGAVFFAALTVDLALTGSLVFERALL